jgi:transcriptional regulator with XRE-family HTH domain
MQLAVRVALNIRNRRRQIGLTQVELARKITELAGRIWAQPQVSDLERGKFSPTLCTLDVIAQALEISPGKLFDLPRG